MKIGYNQVFGYYIEVSKANQAQVPENYIRRQTLVNSERYITPEIKEYESLVLNARERIEEMERSLFRQVCEQISETGEVISRLAKAVAMVDVFVGLAEVAAANGYVRPQLDLGTGHFHQGWTPSCTGAAAGPGNLRSQRRFTCPTTMPGSFC